MQKRIIAICIILLMLSSSVAAGVYAVGTTGTVLPTPQGLTVSRNGTDFIVDWENPESIVQQAISSYKNYVGEIYYIIDWRVNSGAWHYDKEIPSGQDILGFYENIPLQFCGAVYDGGSGNTMSNSVINKVLINIPYSKDVSEWLKSNNVEFRVRYIYSYWDDNEQAFVNQHSSFCDSVLVGTSSPTGNVTDTPLTGDYGIPQAPSAIEAPSGLVSEYMTLNLRWQVPESVKTLIDQKLYVVKSVIDWKLNDGQWNDGLKVYKDKGDASLISFGDALSRDNDGYVHDSVDRGTIGIPYDIPLSVWLANKTYRFRVRYILQIPGENGVIEVVSPFSNTVALGLGTTAPAAPKLEAPSGLNAKITNEGDTSKVVFSWKIPQGTSEVNKKFHVTTYLDCKSKDGKWLTDKEGMEGAKSTTGDLRDNYYVYLDSETAKNYNFFRVFFTCDYKPDTYVYSGFSNSITIDTGSGAITTEDDTANNSSAYKGASKWAVPELDKAVVYGLITDRIKDNMSGPITREEFAEVAVKLYEKYTGKAAVPADANTFVDTQNPEIFKAYNLNIVAGTDLAKKLFSPKDLTNREQVAAMIYRAVKVIEPGADLSNAGSPSFSDSKQVSGWATENVKFMSKLGFMKGSNNRFDPKGTCTREQAVLIAVRVYEFYAGIK